MRQPAFENLLKVLRCEVPDRPTLFEFFLNTRLYQRLAPETHRETPDPVSHYRHLILAFQRAGYDYATVPGSAIGFPGGARDHAKTVSLNDGVIIRDRASFDAYPWPDPDSLDYSTLDAVANDLPSGMKLIVSGPGGVLENVITLVGFDNLCFMIADDPGLTSDVFDAVGSRLVRHYELAGQHSTVGACISNDDWGFKTQTMLSPADMRRYVFPWHKRIVAAIHAGGRPAILHSCGDLEDVMDDVIDDMKFDGKHSFEDVICPVEKAYEQWGGRIALLGGIDLDFICRSSEDEIRARGQRLLGMAATKGGFALGTGNSVPLYIDDEKYFAMTSAALVDD